MLIILWFGLLKFTAHKAEAIRTLELAIAVLIALGPLSARLGATGSALAVGRFLTTLSFLFTRPGIWEETRGGFPTPGPIAVFLLKDVVLLLGAALSSLRESIGSLQRSECPGGPACSRA